MKKANVEIKNRSRLFETIRSLAIVAIVAMIGLTMTVCDVETGSTETEDPKCECVNRVHQYGSPCTCSAKDCTCTEEGPPAECDCVNNVHPYGEPCDCDAPDCTCVEEPPECDCVVKVHPLGEPCDCPLAGTESCDCTEEGEPLKFTVIFDPNDGVTLHTTHLVTEGGTATKPEDPTRENYDFVYWYDSETGEEWNFETVVTAEITLKAKWVYSAVQIEMVTVGSGSFKMGQSQGGTTTGNNVNNIHTVNISSFYIGKYEVKQKEYQTVMGSLPSDIASVSTGDNFPVYYVSWYDALVFCNKLSMLEGYTPAYSIDGKTDPAEWGTVPTTSSTTWNAVTVVANSTGYRLPTEAQWEYAAKGGPLANNPYYLYSGSNTSTDVGVNANTAGPKATGTLAANELGIKDMSGNVWEWCWDWYNGGPYTEDDTAVGYVPVSDPVGPVSGTQRIVRGGSYRQTNVAGQLASLRSVYRMYLDPQEKDANYSGVGFRIVRPFE